MDLALNNLQWLIYHKTKQKQTKPSSLQAFFISKSKFVDVQNA